MRLVPKSCLSRIVFFIVLVTILFYTLNEVIFKSIFDLLDSDDKLKGKYDAVILESWNAPQSIMLKVADSLYKSKIVQQIYITHFKPNSIGFYSGGSVPKYINEIINLYILEFSTDTALYKKIPIEPKDPVTLNLANQVSEFLKSKNYKRLIVISEAIHSQRTRLAFKKVFKSSGIEVATIPVESGSTKYNWWKTDIGLSSVFSELIKLIYYLLFVL